MIFWFSYFSYGQLNVVFFSNDQVTELTELIDELTREKRFKGINLRILNVNSNNSVREEIIINGQTIDQVNMKKSCDFNICEKFTSTIESDFSNLIYFYSKKSIPCIQENEKINESSVNSSMSKEFVKEKLDYQLSYLKKNKKTITLYFSFIREELFNQKPVVSFKLDTLHVKEGETIELTPDFTTKSGQVIWSPSLGLSCTNCAKPNLKPKSNISYTVKYLDEEGCVSNEARISVIVKTACDSLKNLEIQLNKFKKVFGQDFEYEILPISKEGGFRYDIPVSRNCASKFKLSIKDIYGKVVFVVEKEREEILNNGLQLYGEESKLFNFRINLKEYYREIQEGAVIQIESYDDNGKKFKTYVSPQVSFSGCSAQ